MQLSSLYRYLWLIPVALVVFHGIVDNVVANQLVTEVNQLGSLEFFESSWCYAYLHILSFVPVFLLSFDRRVHYYRQWRFLLPGTLLITALFIVWDVWFTVLGVWGFNSSYYLGFTIFHLPIEEWSFFFTIPFCCVFIYECVGVYLSTSFWERYERNITWGIICLLSVGVVLKWGHMYTVTTFGLSLALLLAHLRYGSKKIGGRFYLTYLISCIPFFLVNGILTGSLTEQPVVMYNPDEYFGLRLGTVPLDDMVYSLLLLKSNIWLYEYVKRA